MTKPSSLLPESTVFALGKNLLLKSALGHCVYVSEYWFYIKSSKELYEGSLKLKFGHSQKATKI